MRFTSVLRLTNVLRGASVASLRRFVSSSQPHSNLTKSFAAPLLIASAGFGLASSGVFADNGWIEIDAFGVDELEDGEMKAVSSDITFELLCYQAVYSLTFPKKSNVEIQTAQTYQKRVQARQLPPRKFTEVSRRFQLARAKPRSSSLGLMASFTPFRTAAPMQVRVAARHTQPGLAFPIAVPHLPSTPSNHVAAVCRRADGHGPAGGSTRALPVAQRRT